MDQWQSRVHTGNSARSIPAEAIANKLGYGRIAAGEVCPIWPGGPVSTHWGLPDPAAIEGTDARIAEAFADTYAKLEKRLKALVALRLESMDRATLKRSLDRLAHPAPEPA